MIITNDGHNVTYIEKRVDSSSPLIIFSHGITVNKSENGLFEEFEKYFNKEGLNTIRYDFRGHGESPIKDQDCTIMGMIQDFISIYKYSELHYDKVFLISTSFGCSINLLALNELATPKLKKIIFINPVVDYKKTFTKTKLPWAKSFFPQTGMQDAIANSPLIVGSRKFKLGSKMAMEMYYLEPEMVTLSSKISMDYHHGTLDTMVPYESTVELYNKSKCNSKLYTYEASHGIKEERETLILNVKRSIKEAL